MEVYFGDHQKYFYISDKISNMLEHLLPKEEEREEMLEHGCQSPNPDPRNLG